MSGKSKKPPAPMPLSERAKIFAPFSALKGLSEALAAKEKRYTPKVELSESALEELNEKFLSLAPGQITTVVYYHTDSAQRGEYLRITGKISKIDRAQGLLVIVDTPIPVHAIREILSDV